MAEARPNRRGWLAFLLNYVAPGLGHLYAGRTLRALSVLLMTCTVLVPVILVVPLWLARSAWSIVASIVAMIALYALVSLDAARCARRSGADNSRRWVRWSRAVAFAAFGTLFMSITLGWYRPYLPRSLSRMPTGSMLPTILVGDQMVIDRRLGELDAFLPGDIVTFRMPGDPSIEHAKRIVGLPGQVVEVRGGGLVLDGLSKAIDAVEDEPFGTTTEAIGGSHYRIRTIPVGFQVPCSDWGPERIPVGTVFVLGDNRCQSHDSRHYGVIPMDHISGRVLRVYWSIDPGSWRPRWQRLGLALGPR